MHNFVGKWITDDEFFNLKPRNVFHKQLEVVDLPCNEHRNRHILFRKEFETKNFNSSKIYISADDYYKLYINGEFVCQGPSPCYHFNHNYNVVDVTKYLKNGKNVIAVHTLYQGLTPEETDTLYVVLEKMTANLQAAAATLPEPPLGKDE